MTTTLLVPANTMNFAKGTVTAQDETITLSRMPTFGGVAVELWGTWTGTATFECLVDTNWVAFNMTPSNSGTDASTSTSNGVWSKQANGIRAVRVRFSTASGGTLGVSIRASNQRIG